MINQDHINTLKDSQIPLLKALERACPRSSQVFFCVERLQDLLCSAYIKGFEEGIKESENNKD